MPPGEVPKERKDEKKVDGKKKTQAEIEQEMAALQYTNPMLLEVSRYAFCFIALCCKNVNHHCFVYQHWLINLIK